MKGFGDSVTTILTHVFYVLAVVVAGEGGPKVATELSRHATVAECLRAAEAAPAPVQGTVACVKRMVTVKEGR